MGGCCTKRKAEDTDILETVTNTAMTSKLGKHSKSIKSTLNNTIFTLSGNGIALGSCMLDCDMAYWEVKINTKPENIKIGIKRYDPTKDTDMDNPQSIKESYLDDSTTTEDAWYYKDINILKEGDIIGIHWDQTDLPMLSFTRNGVYNNDTSILRIRPANNIFPAISIKGEGSCDVIFDESVFTHKPKSSRFGMILCSSNLI